MKARVGLFVLGSVLLAFLLVGCGESGQIASETSPEEEPTPTPPGATSEMSIDEAIARGDIDSVRRILAEHPEAADTGANPRLPPLHAAILRKKPRIATILIEAGADVSAVDSNERTAIHLVVERDLPELVEPLAKAGAPLSSLDSVGWTPLHWAAAKDNLPLAKVLIEAGADTDARTARGGTILHEAAATGSGEMVRYFLRLGVDPTVVASDGGTALEVARDFENVAAIKILEAQGNAAANTATP